MSIFDYTNFIDPRELDNNPHCSRCTFCNTQLISFPLRDRWNTDFEMITDIHSITQEEYIEIHGLEDSYFKLDYEKIFIEVHVHVCSVCGWWRIVKDLSIAGMNHQIWQFFFGVTAVLKNLDLDNINIPLEEITKYLFVKYESRFSIKPRLFENVVADVFKNIGYHSLITGYSHDGGIDVILEKNNKQIGVQVKRYKNKIKVEQIRALAGSLILGGYTNGMYVTTSDFQSGVYKCAHDYSQLKRPVNIQLLNAKDFYDALKITQKSDFSIINFIEKLEAWKLNSLCYYGWETPMNSL